MRKNEEARKLLRKSFENDKLDLPDGVRFILDENKTQCRMKLNPKRIQTENMQQDSNAFEGWAIALHIALEKPGTIILDIDGTFEDIAYETNGHWGRFLYRALRFSEQYEWFELMGEVKKVVGKFNTYITANYFTNNLAEGEAGEKQSHGDENNVEAVLAKEDKLLQSVIGDVFDIGENKVYRQLPVGLFKISESEITKKPPFKCLEKMKVFTGGKSAIDLWTWDKNRFEVIELKTKNPMMGIITEIFFYTNYMYDFLVENKENRRFRLNNPKKNNKDDRGYLNISENKFTEILGIMLADQYHSILENPKVLEVLNCNGKEDYLKYKKAYYQYSIGCQVSPKKMK